MELFFKKICKKIRDLTPAKKYFFFWRGMDLKLKKLEFMRSTIFSDGNAADGILHLVWPRLEAMNLHLQSRMYFNERRSAGKFEMNEAFHLSCLTGNFTDCRLFIGYVI